MSQATVDANTHAFRAETKQLLDIVIHSLYSNKEIFLRELISNASDALDRQRLETLTVPDASNEGEILEIRLEADPAARTLSISDNGIGMSRDEVIENLVKGDSVGRDATGQMGSGGKFELAALVMPATVDHVRAISEHGERMPAKSTYFYPKLLGGMVVNSLE